MATIRHLAREAVAPDLADLGERIAALEAELAGDAPAEPEDRSVQIERRVDGKRVAGWIDKHYSRSELDAALGSRRATVWKWRRGIHRQTKIAKVEEFLRDLGGDPKADLAALLDEDEGA